MDSSNGLYKLHKLKISSEANKTVINYLDDTLVDLTTGKDLLYIKPKNMFFFINKRPNQPPAIIKKILNPSTGDYLTFHQTRIHLTKLVLYNRKH